MFPLLSCWAVFVSLKRHTDLAGGSSSETASVLLQDCPALQLLYRLSRFVHIFVLLVVRLVAGIALGLR